MEFPAYGSPSRRSQTPNNSPAHQQNDNVPSSSSSPSTSAAAASRAGGSTSTSTSEPNAGKPPSNAFSKFFTQLKNLITDAASSDDVSPGVDHCCKTSRCHYGLPIHHLDVETLSAFGVGTQCASSTTPSSKGPTSQVCSRLIVYRDCDRRGRKILFDSEHVSSDYVYLKPTDPKLLKQLGEYVFGCVPLASASSSMDLPPNFGHKRFCKWKLEGQDQPNKTMYIWSQIFEMGSYSNANRNNSTNQDHATTVDYSSSSSEHSSGYESGGGGMSSASNAGAAKTFSLPLFNQRPSMRGGSQSSFPQTRSLPGRIDSYKTNLALVWILTQEDTGSSTAGNSSSATKIPFPYLSPLVEKLLLNPLSNITRNFYHNSNNFVTSLKNISTTLNYDLTDFLKNPHVVNLSMIKAPLPDMVNSKLVCKFLELILTNMDSCVVLNLKKWTEVKAILYFMKMFLRTCVCKCGLLDSRRDSLVETGTDVISMAAAAENDLEGVDSGIELEGSSSKLLAVSSSSMYQSSRKWSVVSEEGSDLGGGESSQDEGDCGRVSFHLGDVDVDQSEARLALGDVDLTRLQKGGRERRLSIESTASEPQPEITPSPSRRPPLEVKLNLGESKLKDSCPVKYTPCFHCNGTYITEHNHFNPFYFCQVLAKPGQVSYDMEYVSFVKIIELYGSGLARGFNLNEEGSSGSTHASTLSLSTSAEDTEGSNKFIKKIKDFVEGYIQLSKVTNDSGKLDNYVAFQMEEIQEYIP